MIRAAQTDKKLKESILELLSFCTEHGISLDESEILQHLPVRASSVGVNSHLRWLVEQKKVTKFKDNSYGIIKAKFSGAHRLSDIYKQMHYSRKVKNIVKVAKMVPFIKAVLISSDSILHPIDKNKSHQELIIVTLPNRIYLAKDIIRSTAYRTNNKQDKAKSKKNSLKASCQDIYYSTAGLRFVDKMGKSQLEKVLWAAFAKPIYGKSTWQNLLHNDPFISRHLPNNPYVHKVGKIDVSTSRWLDSLDNARYRDYLQEMSKLKDFKDSSHFLRIRPDVFIVKEN